MNSETVSIIITCLITAAVLVVTIKCAPRWPVPALVISLVGSLFCIAYGIILLITYGPVSIGYYLLPTAAFLWFPCALLTLSLAPISTPYSDIPWWKTLARSILFILLGLFLFAGLLVVFNALGLIFFVFLVVGTLRYRKAARCNQALEIISTLAAATRQNLPLPAALQAAAFGRNDTTAWIFNRIAYWLTQGYCLGESVRKGYPRCLPELIMTIDSAESINQLPQALKSLEKDLVTESDESRKIRPVHPWYPMIVLGCIPILAAGMLVFIVPTFASVIYDLSDGRSGLPAATQFFVDLSKAVSNVKTLCILIGGILAIYLGWTYYHYRIKISCKPGPFADMVDRARWFGPIQNKLERNLSMLRLVEILRPALTSGLSIPRAIAASLETKMNICYKKRVARWLTCVENGQDVSRSAQACGVGRSIAWALDDKINPGQAPALLEMLEENCRNKHNYLGNIIRSILWPLTIVTLGAFVGFFVYAMFLPMVQIITICIQDINP